MNMKKFFTLISIFWILSLISYSQTPYYDAIFLNKNCISTNDTTFLFNPECVSELSAILRNYLPEEIRDDPLSESQILEIFSENPFWGEQIKEVAIGGVSANDAKFLSSAVSSIGSLDVTNFADGIARFIVARTKQELSTSFFERFKRDLDSIRQIQLLFPATYMALRVIDKEIYNYTSYLILLQKSFQKDLTLLIPNIENTIKDKSMNIVFNKYPEIRIILLDALYLVKEFSGGKHPGEIIHNYISNQANIDSLSKVSPNLYPALQALDLFSQSMRSKQVEQYWISPDSLKLLFLDNVTVTLYLGFIYEQASQIEPDITFNQTKFITILENFQTNTKPYQDYLTSIISKGSNANYYYKIIKDKQLSGKDKPDYQDYYSLYEATLGVLESLVQIPVLSSYELDSKLGNYFNSARSLGNIYVDIYEKQYTSAVLELSSLYTILISEKIQSDIIAISDKIKNMPDSAIKEQLKSEKAKLENIQKGVSLILKYGTFAATIAGAENSDEIHAAIEAIALPVGSARIKRESDFNVALNAYCGLFGGMERIKGVDDKYKINSFGVIVPIGISISSGKSKFFYLPVNRKGHFSHTLFLSVIDIGALTSFRFADDSTATVPDIQLKDIISPGVFYSLGIPKVPLSLNFGFQIGPLLRKVTATTNTISDNYTKFSISLCVDIPVLNLYNNIK